MAFLDFISSSCPLAKNWPLKANVSARALLATHADIATVPLVGLMFPPLRLVVDQANGVHVVGAVAVLAFEMDWAVPAKDGQIDPPSPELQFTSGPAAMSKRVNPPAGEQFAAPARASVTSQKSVSTILLLPPLQAKL